MIHQVPTPGFSSLYLYTSPLALLASCSSHGDTLLLGCLSSLEHDVLVYNWRKIQKIKRVEIVQSVHIQLSSIKLKNLKILV